MRHFTPVARLAPLLIAAALSVACAPEAPPPAATFAGSAACAACHAAEHAAWSGSQHALAMQEATPATASARFDDAVVMSNGTASRFFARDGRLLINTPGADGKPADFELRYAFGVAPLQQFLVPVAGGRLQALGLAWDVRPASAGGQRWFELYTDPHPRPGEPLHWTGIDQNWNYQCADCHSTNLRKNYDARTRTFATTWSEISVGCEACHGPSSNHVAWAGKADGWRALAATKGLVNALDERRGVAWPLPPAGTAQRSTPRASAREIETCARCHARRGQFDDDIHAGQDWLDAFRPALLEPGLYHPDGQQRDEVYTWGSFVQSRMHAAGVTCADCHEPHGGKLRAPGNAVCAQCHAPATFEAATHHRHEPGSAGAECAACHMPATTYMVVDPRRDHSLRIPRPDLSVTLGVPNACDRCHAERGPQWAADAIAAWYPQRKPGFQSFAETFATAERGDPAAAAGLAALARDAAQPAIVRASALARGAGLGSPLAAEIADVATGALADADALVRAAAAEALAMADPAQRAERLAPLLADPVRLVRMAAARALAGESEGRLVGAETAAFARALGEWQAAQDFNADRPESQLNRGVLELERGSPDAAARYFEAAVALDPTFVQGWVNLADAARVRGDEPGAERALRAALERDPRGAVAHHALGLSLVRQGRKAEAVAALARAHELAPDDARFAFVYAVALHDTGEERRAVELLRESVARHPQDTDLREALMAWE